MYTVEKQGREWLVINIERNIIQSAWSSIIEARITATALNRRAAKKAKV